MRKNQLNWSVHVQQRLLINKCNSVNGLGQTTCPKAFMKKVLHNDMAVNKTGWKRRRLIQWNPKTWNEGFAIVVVQ